MKSDQKGVTKPFWIAKSLEDFTETEWESVCDGCARCCLIKLEDDTSRKISYTNVVCKLLDQEKCRCTRYSERHQLVKECIQFSAGDVKDMSWLPTSCGYRRLAEGRGLADWHPLVSGNVRSVHDAGISVRDTAISEEHIHPEDLENFVISWMEID